MGSSNRRRDVASIVAAVSLSSVAVLGMAGCSTMLRRLAGAGRQAPRESTQYNERPQNDSTPMYDMKVTDKWLSTDYSGQRLLVIDFDFTNNDVNQTSPGDVAYGFQATQAGNKLGTGYLDDEVDGAMSSNETYSDVEPGAKSKGQVAFELANEADDVDIQFSCHTRDYSQQPITYQETVKLADVQTKQTDVGVKVEIGNAYAYTDFQGKKGVLVEMTYTNEKLDGSETSMLFTTRTEAKQGNSDTALISGMSPKGGFPDPYEKELDAAMKDTKKGKTVKVADSFALEDGNDSQTLHLKIIASDTPDMVVLAEKDIDLSQLKQLPQNADESQGENTGDPFDNASV